MFQKCKPASSRRLLQRLHDVSKTWCDASLSQCPDSGLETLSVKWIWSGRSHSCGRPCPVGRLRLGLSMRSSSWSSASSWRYMAWWQVMQSFQWIWRSLKALASCVGAGRRIVNAGRPSTERCDQVDSWGDTWEARQMAPLRSQLRGHCWTREVSSRWDRSGMIVFHGAAYQASSSGPCILRWSCSDGSGLLTGWSLRIQLSGIDGEGFDL